MINSQNERKKMSKPYFNPKVILAMFLMMVMVFGTMPLEVFAQSLNAVQEANDTATPIIDEGAGINDDVDGGSYAPEPITIRFMGEELTLTPDENGYLHITPQVFADSVNANNNGNIRSVAMATSVDAFADFTEFTLPGHFYLDGQRTSMGDARVMNISPVAMEITDYYGLEDGISALSALGDNPTSALSGLPSFIITLMNQGEWHNSVTMNHAGRTVQVSTKRYVVYFSSTGTEWETFCADPTLRGPENSAANYGAYSEWANPAMRNVLRYGFPTNPYLSDVSLPEADRIFSSYTTRVAVARVANPAATFPSGDATVIGISQDFANNNFPGAHRDFDNTRPAIVVNGVRFAEDLGREVAADVDVAQSEAFTVTYNRRGNMNDNPFYFEWAAGTPAGARLVVGGQAYTYPSVPAQSFRGNVSFHIEMDNTEALANQEVKVYLVGVDNAISGRVWRLQNSTEPHLWQDMVLYIPYIRSSAVFSFQQDETPNPGRLRVRKVNQYTNQQSPMTFTITGPNNFQATRNSGSTLENLTPGPYTVTTNTGFSETVTVGPNQTEDVVVTYYNGENGGGGGGNNGGGGGGGGGGNTSITIQKIDAISRENIPGAMVRLVGMSANYISLPDGQTISFNNTGIQLMQVLTEGATTVTGEGITSTVSDGVWTITGLPYGMYMVYEYRAPDGYSLLPAHTARGFWLAPPNWNVDIEMPDFSLDWNASESESTVNWSLGNSGGNMGAGGDPEAGWHGEGSVTIPGSEMSPPDFVLEESPVASAVNIIFENYPFSEVIIYKREASNGIGNNQLLEGATFRIQGFFAEGNSPQVIDQTATTGPDGRVVFRNLPAGGYTVTEIAPPSGYLLGEDFVWHVNVGWGQTEERGTAPTHTFFNIPKSSLEILKIDGMTNAVLAGAIFELYDPTTGETWQATTGADGIAVFGVGSYGNFLYPGRTYIVREIVAPSGYILMDRPREVVLSPGDENRITWRNYHNPSLTIIKRDAYTHEHLAGAVFDVTFENGQPIPGSPFTTDGGGRIVIPQILGNNESERTVIVTEISPPPGYNLANPNWQRVTIRAGEDNVITFDNERMPYLEIIKVDAVTGEPIPGAWFHVEYLGALQGTGNGNIGPVGPLTGNPFITDQNGRILIPRNYSGRFLIREIRAANGYWLDPLEQNRTWIIEIRDNEDYTLVVENTMLPTLVIRKRNAVTWQGIPMTRFRVQFEQPNSPNVQLIGYFNTDRDGYIIIPFVNVGWYIVTEVRAAPGMTLPSNPVSRIFLSPGDNTYRYIGAIRDMPGITRHTHPTLLWPVIEEVPPPTPPTEAPRPQRPELTPELLQTILQILDMLRQMRD
jgi:hypothetical protein